MRVYIVAGRSRLGEARSLADYARARGLEPVSLVALDSGDALRVIAPPFVAEDPEEAKAILEFLSSGAGQA